MRSRTYKCLKPYASTVPLATDEIKKLMRDDPDHGFRLCVNALINKCLKPYASTVPLATDETTSKFTVSALIGQYRYARKVKGLLSFTHLMEFTAGADS
jgi:hypothetical protein